MKRKTRINYTEAQEENREIEKVVFNCNLQI